MPPFASILVLLLALSTAGNLWLFHSRDKALESAAQYSAAYDGAIGAANLCSASVQGLADESRRRHDETMKRLAAQSGQVKAYEQAAIGALSARPADPSDLCASVAAYLRQEVRRERGATK